MMPRDNSIFLLHIAESFEKIIQYLNGMSEETFACDSLVQDAVIRNYEIIGEAAKNIPDNFRILHPAIDWSGMAGLRDILIHHYFGIDLISIWNISQKQAPTAVSF